MDQMIRIRGGHENNLKHIDLDIPKNQLVVFTGVSGSGKSSLVFDTIAVESMRQLNETFPHYVRSRMPHYDPPLVDGIENLTTAIVIDQRPFAGNIRSTVGTMTEIAPMLRLLFSRCAKPALGTSNLYSFNDPQGMCPACSGIGRVVRFDLKKILDLSKSLNEGAILFPGHQIGTYQWYLYANSSLLDPTKSLGHYSDKEWQDFLHGSGVIVNIPSPKGINASYNLTYEGFEDRITRLFLKRDINSLNKTNQKIIRQFTHDEACPDCQGARLNPAVLASLLAGRNIFEIGELELHNLFQILDQVKDPFGLPVAHKIQQALKGIMDMGLGYLCLNRPSISLSGGESQRLKMVRHLGSSLVGLTYIFDEPSVGLHPKDVSRLNQLLLKLRDRGNTVLVIEHDRNVISIADQVIDMGPLAGKKGGQVIFQGSVHELLQADTLTARFMKSQTPLNMQPRQAKGFIAIEQARLHNLQNVSVQIPREVLTTVTGVAGSGKSSLVCGELLARFPEVVHISQAPIGITSRSTPATYVGVMDGIRKLFAQSNKVSDKLFSYNSTGACPVCNGKGVIVTEMAFMDPVAIPCEACNGKQYSDEALSYLFKGMNILDALNLTVDEAIIFFYERKIMSKLINLQHVGLGYLTLGQPTNTLSGGECQRIKLANHLTSRGAIYAMDEPTTGLHGADIAVLMKLLNHLVDNGNTVIVVEHDLDVIKQSDWVIDLGPEGGKNGGRVLFEGTPEQLLACQHSVTAEYLRATLASNPNPEGET